MKGKKEEFVEMPNHFHEIIIIGINDYNVDFIGRVAMHFVSTFVLKMIQISYVVVH